MQCHCSIGQYNGILRPGSLSFQYFREKFLLLLQRNFHHIYHAGETIRFPNCSGVITRSPSLVITFVSLVREISSYPSRLWIMVNTGIRFLQQIIINPCHFQVIHADQLKFRKSRIYHRPKHIKKSPDTQIFYGLCQLFLMPDEKAAHAKNKYWLFRFPSSISQGHFLNLYPNCSITLEAPLILVHHSFHAWQLFVRYRPQ